MRTERAPRSSAVASSTTPRKLDNACWLKTEYARLKSGLVSTNGRVASASQAVNLSPPIITSTSIVA